MSRNRFFTFGFCLLVLVGMAFPVFAQAELTETLEIEDYEFTIMYPEGWNTTESSAAGQTAYVIQELSSGLTVALVFLPNMGGAVPLDTMSESIAAGAGLTVEGDVEEIIVGGGEGVLLSGELDALEGSYAIVIVASFDDTLFSMSMIDPAGASDETEATFRAMIASIEVAGEGSEVEGAESSGGGRSGAEGGSDGGKDGAEAVESGAAIEYGDAVEGELSDEEVSFSFEGAEGDVVVITMLAEDGAFDTALTLLDEDGEQVAYNDDAVIETEDMASFDSQLVYVLPADGVYTIVGAPLGGTGEGAFTLSLELAETETLEYGDSVSGEIAEDGSSVFYIFEGEEGDVVQISMVAEDGDELDTLLAISGADGTTLALNDDDSTGAVEGRNSFIELELPEDGFYVIYATRFSGEGEFELTLEAE